VPGAESNLAVKLLFLLNILNFTSGLVQHLYQQKTNDNRRYGGIIFSLHKIVKADAEIFHPSYRERPILLKNSIKMEGCFSAENQNILISA
jgi:hypothetical protein